MVPVSVVIPCYQCAGTIEQAVNSVVAQSARPAEVILVDDCSGDDTLATLRKLRDKHGDWLRIIELPENSGAATARNAGWAEATQPYLAFLDSDDTWHPKKIEVQHLFMAAHPDIALSGHAHRRFSDRRESLDWEIGDFSAETISKIKILLANRFITPSVMVKSGIPFRFSEGKRHMEDHLLWTQIICAGLPAVKLSSELAAIYKFSYGAAGLSSDYLKMHSAEKKNYRQLAFESSISPMASRLLSIFATLKFIKRLPFIGFIKSTNSTARNIYDYMSVTYSISGLLVALGLFGRYELAADVAVAQGAVMATFYVMSGDARHLILSEKMKSGHALFFRLLMLLPLSGAAYFLCQVIGHMEFIIAGSVIARRGAEWLSEVHLTEIERQGGNWHGLPLQILLFFLVVIQIIYFDDFWLLWIWAFSPVFFSLGFLLHPKPCHFHSMLPHLASTATIGLSIFAMRVLIVDLAGKIIAGTLFPALTIGSFAGTLFGNVLGPTLSRKNTINSKYLTYFLIAWGLFGLALLAFSETFFQKALAFSITGGAVMVFAIKSRLSILKARDTLGPDLLTHLSVIISIPIIYYLMGSEWLASIYLWNAILAWLFYKAAQTHSGIPVKYGKQLAAGVVFLLTLPIFIQLSGNIYNTSGYALVDSGGLLTVVPLPLSLFISYAAIVLFNKEIYRSKPTIIAIAGMFLLLLVSSLIAGHGKAKLILLAQYTVPIIALPLGIALGGFDRKLIARVFLYLLTGFVPLQLLCTWIQGQFALTHYIYIFSVYQHYQYVPLVFASMFLWAWVELRDTHKTWIYMLAPWMAIYMAAGNSILALFGLIAFAICFSLSNYRSRSAVITTALLVFFSSGYLFLNTQIPHEIKYGKLSLFFGKIFDQNKQFLFLDQPNSLDMSASKEKEPINIPINVADRLKYWKYYSEKITESPFKMLFGHESPPPRSKTTSAHNYYLDLAYNFGVLAWLPLFLLMVYTIYLLTKCRGNAAAVWLVAIVFYILLIDSNLKVTLRQPYPGLFAFFLWGVLISALSEQTQDSRK